MQSMIRTVTQRRTLQLFQTSRAAAACCSVRQLPTRSFSSFPGNIRIDPRSSFFSMHQEQAGLAKSVDTEETNDEFDDLFDQASTPGVIIPLPDRLNIPIHTLFAGADDTEVGTIILNAAVFGQDPIRVDLLKRSVDYYRNKKRGRRKAVTKTIGQVSGSGRKVRPQKGQGGARMGHSRPPHHRGGAKAHGPKNVTDYSRTKLNKKVRRQAVRHALSQKLLEGNLVLLNELHPLPTHKTNDLIKRMAPLWGQASVLILDAYYPEENDDDEFLATSYHGMPLNLVVASGNLHQVTVGNEHAANVHDILKHEKLVLTLAALEKLEDRLENI